MPAWGNPFGKGADGHPPCKVLAHVLNWGQRFADAGSCRSAPAKQPSPSGIHCVDPCECVELQRLPRCDQAGTGKAISLKLLAASTEAQRRPTCARDVDCNAPHGQCTSTQQCACNKGGLNANTNWGGWNCSEDNDRLGRKPAEKRYRESVWERHYHFDGTDLSQLRTANDSDRELPWTRSRSGEGSFPLSTFGVRHALPRLVRIFGIKSIVDVPCGDFNYMRALLGSHVLRGMGRRLRYTGLDVVQPLTDALERAFGTKHVNSADDGPTLHFARFDLSLQMLWPADLIVIRDLLFHFSKERVLDVLQRVSRSGARYLLTTYFPLQENADRDVKRTYADGLGHFAFWPLNLATAPFSLGPPLRTIGMDGSNWARDFNQRGMGLWSLPLWQHERG